MKDKILKKYSELNKLEKENFIKRIDNEGYKYCIYKLSHLQESILIPYLADRENTSYNIRCVLKFSKEIDIEILKKAINLTRYENSELRTKLVVFDDDYYQIVERYKPIEIEEKSVFFDGDFNDFMNEFPDEEIFDLENCYPIKFVIYVNKKTNEKNLCYTMHHIFSDGWSMELIKDSIKKNYNLLVRDLNYFPENVKPFFKTLLKESTDKETIDFWNNYLTEFKMVQPIKYNEYDYSENSKKGTMRVKLSSCDEFEKISIENKVSNYILALGLYIYSIHQWSQIENISIGIATLNRFTTLQLDSVGLYANTLPLLNRYKKQSNYDFFEKLKKLVFDILKYSDVQSTLIFNMLQNFSKVPEKDIFQTVFINSEDVSKIEQLDNGIMYMQNIDNSTYVQFPILACLEKIDDDFYIRFDYKKSLFCEDKINSLIQKYKELFDKLNNNELLYSELCKRDSVSLIKKNSKLNLLDESNYISELEMKVCEIWKDVLKVDSIGLDDNFFVIGGNSLSCIKVISKMNQKFKRKLKITDIFSNYTIRKISRLLK